MDSTSVESTRWKKSSFADSSCGENALVKANGVVCSMNPPVTFNTIHSHVAIF
jgi:hypothetical protein